MRDRRNTDPNEEFPETRLPEDSSQLHSWANRHGAKHRDFSALRPSRDTDKTPRAETIERRKGVQRAEVAEAAARLEQNATGDSIQRQDARDAEFDQRRRRATVPLSSQHRSDESVEGHQIYSELEANTPRSTHAADRLPLTELTDDFESDFAPRRSLVDPALDIAPTSSETGASPAWLYAPSTTRVSPKPPVAPSVADTLQSSRERVASRWYALKGVFEQTDEDATAAALPRQKEMRTPVLAVFSLAGGVGKTSLVATVGRSLSSMGEKVLLTDTTSHGLLPFYFGANELQHDTIRTFSPPSGSTDAPIHLVSHEMEQNGSEEAALELFMEKFATNSQGMHRILLDLTTASSWLIRQMARMNLTVLVPLAPDMNSVISLGIVEKFFSGLVDGDGHPLLPFYVLNQFDPSLPLHLDVREVLRRKLGDRLLSFVIRRAPAVSEALAEGMTVVDYAPDASVVEDYVNVATWIRTIAAPATAGFRNVRWTER